MFDLNGKTALVTGATGGIGDAIARALHQQGATVAISGTRKEKLDALAGELDERVHVLPCDLSEPEQVNALVGEAETAMGGLDILVNNAGLTRDTLAMRMKDADWERVLDVNLTAAFRLSRAAIKGMMKRKWGRIINISSVVAAIGNPGQANYISSKAGLVGLAKGLAAEVASRNITVNCVSPGFIETPMTADLTDKQRGQMLARVPAERLGTPEEVAACVAFLASAEAGYVTGHTLHANGGMAML